jgi:hypothetical protein
MKKLQKLALSASVSAVSIVAAATPAFAQLRGVDVDPGQGFAENFGDLINGVLSFVMVIAALLVFLYLIWGGIEWITSGGDKGKTESARNKITSAVIGLIVVAASYAVLSLALNFLGFKNLNDVFNQTRSL